MACAEEETDWLEVEGEGINLSQFVLQALLDYISWMIFYIIKLLSSIT